MENSLLRIFSSRYSCIREICYDFMMGKYIYNVYLGFISQNVLKYSEFNVHSFNTGSCGNLGIPRFYKYIIFINLNSYILFKKVYLKIELGKCLIKKL